MKRRGAQKSGQAARKPPKAAGKYDHLEWQGNSSGDESAEEEEVEEEDNRETPDNKRIRLAKEYLDRLKEEEESSGSESGSDDESGSDEDRVGAKLHRDVERALGKLFIPVAENLDEVGIDVDAIRRFRGHQLSVTAIVVTDDEASVFTGSKDCSVLKWDVETGTRIAMMGRNGLPKGETPEPGSKRTHQNQAEVLAVAASTDGKFVACAGRDKLVHVFDTRSCELLQSFKGHQDAITSLAFRHNTHTLFSGGLDRVIKNWNLDHMEYVESLYGHQSEVFGLDSMHNDRCVSAGRDRTLRMWKIPEESQLVFNHSGGSIDCVRMLAEQYYVTGGEDGGLALWNVAKKKPLSQVTAAHTPPALGAPAPWVNSLASLRGTDLIASGSSDGLVRFWNVDWKEDQKIRAMETTVAVDGFVNSMAFAPSGRFLVSGVGQEHKLGRWSRIKKARNGWQMVMLPDEVSGGMA